MTSGRDQSREDKIGIWGEAAVFNILQDIFGPAIDESAWTSELRHHVQGHTVWIPDEPDTLYSDFTILDRTGTLSRWMVAHDVEVPPHWTSHYGDDVLYHIEVKSTAKDFAEEPFLMSHLQMDKAREVSESWAKKTKKNAREVFVIFRVYEVESETPGLEVYCDPWGMVQRGGWHCATQEWRVTPA
jgi:hypothetical protein